MSTYRLFVHLNTAIIIFSILLWNSLNLLRVSQDKVVNSTNYPHIKKIRRGAFFLLFCLGFNVMSGALVAGIDAGKVYNLHFIFLILIYFNKKKSTLDCL